MIVDANGISIRVDLHSFCISSLTCQAGTCTGDSASFGREMGLAGMPAGCGCVPGQSVFVRQIFRQVGGKIEVVERCKSDRTTKGLLYARYRDSDH